ncbi:MAG: LamG-like jellyroll fold domain-containing protein [Methanobacteriota archaeon]
MGWWPGDDHAADIAGARNGILANGASFDLGKVGQAFRLDGSNDFVQIADADVWGFGTNPFTIDLWVNFDVVKGGAAGTLPNVFIGHDEGGGNTNKWVFFYAEGGLWFLTNSPSLGAAFLGPVPFSPIPGQWHHFALTRSMDTYTFYADGIAIGSRTDTRPAPNANARLTFGQAEGLGFLDGRIDEMEIFGRALASDEIQSIFDAGEAGKCKPSIGCAPPPSGLVAWWPGDGNANDIISSNHGLLRNGATSSAPGHVGLAFSFDGVDDFVEVPDSELWAFGAQDFTVDLWANFDSVKPSTVTHPAAVLIGNDEGPGITNKWFFALGGGFLYVALHSPTLGPKFLAQGSFSPILNRWYHLVLTRTSGTFRIYVDGALLSSQGSADIIPNANAPLTIGQAESAVGALEQFFMHGRIDEVEILHRALAISEIDALFKAGGLGKCRNTNPTISSFNASPATEGSPVAFAVAASDPDGDALTYSFDVDADGNFDFVGPTSAAAFTWGDDHGGSARIVVSDGLLEAESTTSVTVTNVPPSVTLEASPVDVAEGQTLTLSYTIVDPGSDDLLVSIDWKDGTVETRAYPLGPEPDPPESTNVGPRDESDASTHTYRDNGMFLATVTACDDDGGCTEDSIAITVLNLPPVVSITAPAPGSVFAVGTPITFSGTFTDAGLADTHSARWLIDSATVSGTVTEGDDSGTVTDTVPFAAAGVYQIALEVIDDDGGVGTTDRVGEITAFVVIFDETAGFVTGGGWINSPAGAYALSPALAGRATFGFVSRYQKGADVPSGETEFQFRAADLNFHSTSYEWLVVSSARAQYKGSGRINGLGDYGFLLTVIDGALAGGGGMDKFRIKIWDKVTGEVVYDNQSGSDDFAEATATIASGSIVIHKP